MHEIAFIEQNTNLFRILPVGVLSKNDMGLAKTALNTSLCKFEEAPMRQ